MLLHKYSVFSLLLDMLTHDMLHIQRTNIACAGCGGIRSVFLLVSGARGEADAQNITVLAMWMIEHPGTETEHDETHTRGSGGSGDGSDSSCPGATASVGGKSLDRSSYLCSPGDIASADASEMEEGFSERYSKS